MAAKRRKPGDWRAIAKSREQIPRLFPSGRGLSNIPVVTDAGSAAYRRLMKKKGPYVRAGAV